jgi:uncharacterized membrane protein (DUF2068 family)
MHRSDKLIRLVALFKLLKAAALVAGGIGVLKLVHQDIAATLDHWVRMLGLDPGHRYLAAAIQRATNLSPHKIRDIGIVSFIYAGLFLTEGIGLWLLKRWAEWFTVILTSSLLPIEAYEIARRPDALRILVLLLNVLIVAYLLYRIRSEHRTSPAALPARTPPASRPELPSMRGK